MKKNKVMRFASVVLVMTLLSTCMVGGTFAKYTTSATSDDSARVAYWGFQSSNSIDITGLFKNAYNVDDTSATFAGSYSVNAEDATDVIAPGTTNSSSFKFAYDETSGFEAPEVAYKFTVSTEDSECDDDIKNNPNILWAVYKTGTSDPITWGTWDAMLGNIENLDGNKQYAPGELPDNFSADDDSWTVAWKWIFDENAANKEIGTVNGDDEDTDMGNNASLANVKLVITITATQID